MYFNCLFFFFNGAALQFPETIDYNATTDEIAIICEQWFSNCNYCINVTEIHLSLFSMDSE